MQSIDRHVGTMIRSLRWRFTEAIRRVEMDGNVADDFKREYTEAIRAEFNVSTDDVPYTCSAVDSTIEQAFHAAKDDIEAYIDTLFDEDWLVEQLTAIARRFDGHADLTKWSL